MHNNPYTTIIAEHYDIIFSSRIDTPPCWTETFGNDRPLVLDIGCGSGNFLSVLAQQNPAVNYVGIELKYKRLVKAAKKIKKRELENVRFLQKRAEEVADWFPKNSVEAVHVNFPDPWPKKRHFKNRLLQQDYYQRILHILCSNGHFFLKTDHGGYFAFALEGLQAQAGFQIIACSENLHESVYASANVRTEFEDIFTREQPRNIYYLAATKV